jgi:hypothetical protein
MLDAAGVEPDRDQPFRCSGDHDARGPMGHPVQPRTDWADGDDPVADVELRRLVECGRGGHGPRLQPRGPMVTCGGHVETKHRASTTFFRAAQLTCRPASRKPAEDRADAQGPQPRRCDAEEQSGPRSARVRRGQTLRAEGTRCAETTTRPRVRQCAMIPSRWDSSITSP